MNEFQKNDDALPQIDGPKKLADYQPILSEMMPGARLQEDFTRGRYVLGWSARIFVSERYSINEEHAEDVLRAAVEQLRLEGIHVLGLEPRLRAYERQINDLREDARKLQSMVDSRDSRIRQLEDQIDNLVNGEEDDD